MSADNYIAVYKTKSGYSGFMLFASDNPEPLEIPNTKPLWTVASIREAVERCEEEAYLEYGYQFVGE